MAVPFVHLHVHSPFSFLDGASSIPALLDRAARYGMPALALTDHNNVSGAVEFWRAAERAGLVPIQGAEVTTDGDHHLVLLADGPGGYRNLCRILTRAHLDRPRGVPQAPFDLLARHAAGLFALSGCRRGAVPAAILRRDYQAAEAIARRYRDAFGPDRFYLELETAPLPGSRRLNRALVELGERLGVGVVATGNVHYAERDAFWVHDLLTCARTLTRLDDVHPERRLGPEYFLKPADAVAAALSYLGRAAVARALGTAGAIAARCRPVFEPGRRTFPAFPVPPGETAAEMLRALTYAGAAERYPRLTPAIRDRLDYELDVICRLGFEDYFLLCWDVVAFARRRGIRHAGRGSAADSAVAYCLGITHVDAIARGHLFERFMSLERAQAPDIDIDFDARYRDDVTRYVYQRYGDGHVATVATYNTFHARSAIRDLGKAMGFGAEEIDRLAKAFPRMGREGLEAALEAYPELRASGLPFERYRRLLAACEAVLGFPRHLGTHLGGVVITRRPLTDWTPLQLAAKGVVVTQFDKVGVEDLGLVKLDLLSLRTLGAVEDALTLLRRGPDAAEPGAPTSFDAIPVDDPETYRMLNAAETLGVFQLESPAQRALQARLGASGFEDIVASVAIIRPGPIKGNMVEPYIARRLGQEPVTYLHPALEPILKKTYGVVLFQEQVIEIATAVAGFTPGEADRLRRVMTHARSQREMADIGALFCQKAVERGIDRAAAEAIFATMAGYASYGFCEAHAAAFASTALKTAYLVRHHPAEFYAAILSLEPMGYYPPDVIAGEARRRGVAILPLDVNKSDAGFTVERVPGGRGIRIGLRQLRDLDAASLEALLGTRAADGPFRSLEDFCRRVPAPRPVVENLVLAGAFDALEPNRRALLWRLPGAVEAGRRSRKRAPRRGAAGPRGTRGAPAAGWGPAVGRGPAVGGCGSDATPELPFPEGEGWAGGPAVPDFSPRERFIWEYRLLSMSAGPHYMAFFRAALDAAGYATSATVRAAPAGARVRVAGLPVRPHRPPTKSGRTIVFMSLEDEEGLCEITVFEPVYQRCGHVIFADPVPPLEVRGRVERRGNATAVVADDVRAFRPPAPHGRARSGGRPGGAGGGL